MNDRRILLIIGGGIAAYKSLELIRELARRGVKTRAILTRAGAEFITPLSVASLTDCATCRAAGCMDLGDRNLQHLLDIFLVFWEVG